MSTENDKGEQTVQLVFPLWQGGNQPLTHFSASILEFLAPAAEAVRRVRVPVVPPPANMQSNLVVQDGMTGRQEVIAQLRLAQQILAQEKPDRIVVLGGDCAASLVPFAYLADKHKDEKVGILWLDAHPDISEPHQYPNSHAGVLGNLMGTGDRDMTAFVPTPVPSSRVMVVGLNKPAAYEKAYFAQSQMRVVGAAEAIASGEALVREWIRAEGITRLVVHFDLDVLDYTKFHSVLFNNPEMPPDFVGALGRGSMQAAEVVRIVRAAGDEAAVVGLTIAEFLPFDLRQLTLTMNALPLIGSKL